MRVYNKMAVLLHNFNIFKKLQVKNLQFIRIIYTFAHGIRQTPTTGLHKQQPIPM